MKLARIKSEVQLMKAVKSLSKQQQITQVVLGDMLNLSSNIIYSYTSCRRPASLQTTIKLLNVLGYDLAIVEKEEI